MRTEEIRRLIRGEFGDGQSVDALLAQMRTAGHEAVELIRARLSSDEEARAAAELAWEEIECELPEPRPLEEHARDRLGDGLRKLNALFEEALERSAANDEGCVGEARGFKP